MTAGVRRRRPRPLVVAGLAVAGLALSGVPAWAGVTVDPQTAVQGGHATIAFKVQTDRTDASTTRLDVSFPADRPLSQVLTQPKPGWVVTVERAPIAMASPAPGATADARPGDRVAKVTWSATAEDARIGPAQFDLFSVSLGPLPSDTDRLVFTAQQTYSDGQVVGFTDPALVLTAPVSSSLLSSSSPVSSSAVGAPAATPEPTVLDAVNASAVGPAEDDGRSQDVALGLTFGILLVLIGVGAASAARRRGSA